MESINDFEDHSDQRESSSAMYSSAGFAKSSHWNRIHELEHEQSCYKRYKRIWISLIITICILIVGGIVAYFLLRQGDEPKPPSPDPPVPPFPVLDHYNPYYIDSFTQKDEKMYGTLLYNSTMKANFAERKLEDSMFKADPRLIPTGDNNQVAKTVTFEIGQVAYKTSVIRLSQLQKDRYQPPTNVVYQPEINPYMKLEMAGFEISKNPFGFSFKNPADPTDMFLHTNQSNFLMLDKYMQLDLQLPTRSIYGLGERRTNFTLGEGTWTMWASGQKAVVDDGTGGKQGSGVHPFALVKSAKAGEYFGLYFRNTNAMSPVITHIGSSMSTLSFITTGGKLEIYVMYKGSPKEIIKQYQTIIGLPVLPPLWTLGWHTGGFNIKKQKTLEDMVSHYDNMRLPFEAVWLEDSYMLNHEDFTLNTTSYSTMQNYTNYLNNRDIQVVLSLDPGLVIDDQNTYYQSAKTQNLLLKSNLTGEALVSSQYVNQTVFLDDFSDQSKNLWKQGLTDLHTKLLYNGVSFDKNEQSVSCDGECPSLKKSAPFETQDKFLDSQVSSSDVKDMKWYHSYTNQSEVSTYKLPFIPGQVNLDSQTLSLNASHPSNNLLQYNTHNLNGLLQGIAVGDLLYNHSQSPLGDKRPFVLSKSTFAGSGGNVQHWMGDDFDTWADLRYAIAGAMNMAMFGIPVTGFNACGFKGNATFNDSYEAQELCARQVQLAAFMPLARQRFLDDVASEINLFTMPDIHIQNIIRYALFSRLNYQLLLYTCLFETTQTGETCFDPLFFHYPNDNQTLIDVEHSFMFANALKVTPVLEQEARTVNSYFPKGTWVNMNDVNDILISKGEWIEIPIGLDTVVHLKPGKIIPQMANPGNMTTTTNVTRNGHMEIVVNRNDDGFAHGRFFMDGATTQSALDSHYFEWYELQHSPGSIKRWNLDSWQAETPTSYFHKFIITNAGDLKNVNFACIRSEIDATLTVMKATYQPENNTLEITGPNGESVNLIEAHEIIYGNDKTDLNPCNITQQYYTFAQGKPSLDGAEVHAVLTSKTPQAHSDLMLSIYMKSDMVNIQWNFVDSDKSHGQFSMPSSIIHRPDFDKNGKLSDVIDINVDPSGAFTISVKSKQSGQKLYDVTGIILDSRYNFIDAVAYVNSQGSQFRGITGLSDQVSDNLFLQTGVYTLWNRNANSPKADGEMPAKNMYASSPFYMAQASSGTEWFGVYHNTAAASDWWIFNNKTARFVNVTTFSTGGVGDLFIMFASTPDQVTQLYHSIIGLPALVPQWALGWHQCKYGYNNTVEVAFSVQKYKDFDLPLDAQWIDIDLYEGYKMFKVDQTKFKGISDLVKTQGVKFVPILNPGIAVRESSDYYPYNELKAKDAAIKTSSGENLIGALWPGDVIYTDFLHAQADQYWSDVLTYFTNQTTSDGFWLEMNEIENFCNGTCYQTQADNNPLYDKMPYIPGGRDMELNTISLNAKHAGNVLELDTHNIYATLQSKSTFNYFQNQAKSRNLLVSRSGSQGLGQFGGRLLGNNFSNQTWMGYSITSIMAQSIAGVSLSGADICGFFGNTTADLCARWYVVGAFYPLSRNHNNLGNLEQEPWSFKEQYLSTIRNAMFTKLSLIRYYNTELLRLHQTGGTFFKPLWFEFPQEDGAYTGQQLNVMLGKALKLGVQSTDVSDALTSFYYPQGTWCDVYRPNSCMTQSVGGNQTQPTNLGDFYLYLRQGSIIPFQNITLLQTFAKINNTGDLWEYPIEFLILPECDASKCTAKGAYANDVSTVLDLTNNLNNHTIYYEHSVVPAGQVAPKVTLNFTQLSNYTGSEDGTINQNDYFNRLQVYNAKALGLTGSYSVAWYPKDSPDQPRPTTCSAEYDAYTDRLAMSQCVLFLNQISELELTVK